MIMTIAKEPKKHKFISIRTKLTAIIVLLIILTVSTVQIYTYQKNVSQIEAAVEENELSTAILTASRLQTEIMKTVSVLETASYDVAFAAEDVNVLIQGLLAIQSQNQIFSTVFITDSALYKLANEKGEPGSLADREYLQELKKTQQTVISREILMSQSTKKASLMIATPIRTPGAPERYLGIAINIDKLQGVVTQSQKSDSHYSFAFDGKNGLVFAHPVPEYIGSLKLINPDEKDAALVAPELQNMAKEAIAGHSGHQIYEFDGVKVITAYTNIPGTTLGVATRMTYADAMADVKKSGRQTVIIIVVASLLSALIALFCTKFVADPIKRIAEQANTIASGDFTQTRRITTKGTDEIGLLQQDFINMADKLQSTMEQIGSAAAQIASASNELKSSAAQSAEGANQVAVTVSHVAQGAQDQVNVVDDTVEAVKDIGNEISGISQHASSMEHVAETSASAVSAGGKAIQHAVDSITNINVIVQDTANAIRNLGTFSEKISQVVDTITGIASQTNLLALNAAIEAARAGEHGRGFSIVAEEVRKLAEQAEESAGSIAQMIHEIQSQIQVAIQQMDQSAQEVSTGQEVVLAAGESFNTIQQQINNVNEAVQGITESVHILSASNNKVTESVEKIRVISTDTAGESQTISAATEEQSAGIQEIVAAADVLAKLAAHLEAMFKQYKF